MCKIVDEYARDYAREYAEERVIKMAQSLINRGIDDDIIQEATDLSLEEIANLRKKLSAEKENESEEIS